MSTKTVSDLVNTKLGWEAGNLLGAEVYADDTVSIVSVPCLRISGYTDGTITNSYFYRDINQTSYAPAVGDVLIYEQNVDRMSPIIETYLDGPVTGGSWNYLRGYPLNDQNGFGFRGNNYAFVYGKWGERRFSLDPVANESATIGAFTLALEGDLAGYYKTFFKNIRIEDSAGNVKKIIFSDTLMYTGTTASTGSVNNYTQDIIVKEYVYITGSHERITDLSPIGRYTGSNIQFTSSGGAWFSGRQTEANGLVSGSGSATIECSVLLDNSLGPATTSANSTIVDLGSWESAKGFGFFVDTSNTASKNTVGLHDSKDSYPYSNAKLSTIGTTRKPTWLSAVYDGTDIKLYVDGVLELTLFSATVAAWDSITVGKRPENANEFLRGLVGEVRIWDHARSVAEINNNMFKPMSGNEAGLSHYYPFSDQSSDVDTSIDRAGTSDLNMIRCGKTGVNNEVSISLDNGATWSTPVIVNNGDAIPGMTNDQDCRGVLMKLTSSLWSMTPYTTPSIQSSQLIASGIRVLAKQWDGTQWVERSLKAYNGQWVTSDPRVYKGGRWL